MTTKESKAEREARTIGWRVRDGARGWMRSAVSGNPIQCGPYPEPVALHVARDVIVASRSTTARLVRVTRRTSAALAKAVKGRNAACVRTTVVEARVRVVESERDALRGERDEALATRRQYEAELRHYSTTGRSEKTWAETESEQELFNTEARRDAAQRGWESASEALLQANAVNSVIRNSLTRAEARVGALRAALIATINACPGAGAADTVSDGFLMRAPDEVRGQIERLARERDESVARCEAAETSFLRCAEAAGVEGERPPIGAVVEAIREAVADAGEWRALEGPGVADVAARVRADAAARGMSVGAFRGAMNAHETHPAIGKIASAPPSADLPAIFAGFVKQAEALAQPLTHDRSELGPYLHELRQAAFRRHGVVTMGSPVRNPLGAEIDQEVAEALFDMGITVERERCAARIATSHTRIALSESENSLCEILAGGLRQSGKHADETAKALHSTRAK